MTVDWRIAFNQSLYIAVSTVSTVSISSASAVAGRVFAPFMENTPNEKMKAHATSAEKQAAREVLKGKARIVLSLTGSFLTVNLSFT